MSNDEASLWETGRLSNSPLSLGRVTRLLARAESLPLAQLLYYRGTPSGVAMVNLSLSGLAFLVFGFSLIYLSLTNKKIAPGTRIGIALVGIWLIPGAVGLLGGLLHKVFFSPIVWVPLAIVVGYLVWTTLDRRKPY